MSNAPILLAGDSAVSVEFGEEIHPAVNAQVRALHLALADAKLPGIVETVPTYRSLMIHYDPALLPYDALCARLRSLLDRLDRIPLPPSQVLEIPVLYGGEMGPDLEAVARHAGKSPQEVIRIHSSADYLVYMLGFTPGFPYLGGMDPAIAAPRLDTPRVKIPAGSVGIAGSQTGVYPLDSPGGWQLIGRTPVRMYDPDRPEPILPRAGEYIRFRPIQREEYDRIAAQVSDGTYQCVRRPREEDTP